MRLNVVAPDETKDRAAAIKDAQLQQLLTARPAQIEAWIDTQVSGTNAEIIAGIRKVLKLMMKVLVILARREFRG